MAGETIPEPLKRLAAEAGQPARPAGRPPPQNLGEVGIHIARDGNWFYLGTPITRASLVRLFASVLRR